MSSSAMQAKAQALNVKMEGEARGVLDEIERTLLRKKALESYRCVVKCFEKAGSSGSSEVLDQCSRNCQVPYQQANALVQNVSPLSSCSFWSIALFALISTPYVLSSHTIASGDSTVSRPSESSHDGLSGPSQRFDNARYARQSVENGQSRRTSLELYGQGS